MAHDRQGRALAQLVQVRRMEALARRSEALAALGRVAALDRQIDGIDARVAAEAAALADYADMPALGRWADGMDANRRSLVRRRAGEQRQADALVARAAAAEMVTEQHRELLADHRRKQTEARRRAAERAEWEALAARFAGPR
ncbi:MAG: hypothetical protein KDC18_04055 [Alphaproteobacteria bacterium]|nr:hypothetical protein [Alphaproteobacteria bacterium]MCB9928147.1 hypothetical protein [Alphaproteobacteria bacterium]